MSDDMGSDPDDGNQETGQDVPMKRSLKQLANKDPEFYEFLLQNEKSLLDFDDENIGSEDDDDDGVLKEGNEGNDTDTTDVTKVTEKVLSQWSEKLRANDIKTIRCLMEAFRSAVTQASGGDNSSSRYKNSPNVFNAILQTCYVDLMPAVYRLLKLPVPGLVQEEDDSKRKQKLVDPSKCKNWKAIESCMKKYLLSLVVAINTVTDKKMLCSLLRHTLHMIPFVMCVDALIKKFLRTVCQFWSQGEEEARVLCFLVIIRMIRDKQPEMIGYVVKKLYLSFIGNCKLTTLATFPMIRFMQQSLVELYSLDQTVAYSQTFEFLRQSAVYLRNMMAATVKKDASKKIYNWAFVHSLILWQKVICSLHENTKIQTLVYPYVQIVIGTIKLHPVSKYDPMRFHLIRSLIDISHATGVYIPILPLIVNCLFRLDYSSRKKSDVDDFRPIDLSCTLKVAKSVAGTKPFREAVVKQVYELMLHYLSTQSCNIAFPELVFPAVIKVKKFLKEKCKSAEDIKLLKQLLEKIEENTNFIESHRKSVTFKFSDSSAIENWERDRREESTPLTTFYEKWKKLHHDRDVREMQKRKEKKVVVQKDEEEEESDQHPDEEESESKQASIVPSSVPSTRLKRRQLHRDRLQEKRKKLKISKISREKDRIRSILTKGENSEEFRLTGIELSDDE